MDKQELTHFNSRGEAHMVDVGEKAVSKRVAVAQGRIVVNEIAFAKLMAGDSKKGDVLAVARIAAIQAAKQTALLIPLCHPLALTRVAVDFETDVATRSVIIRAQAETIGQTGVEMEALTAASVGLLTIYDMLKAVDKGMLIEQVCLLHKEGGHSGVWQRAPHSVR